MFCREFSDMKVCSVGSAFVNQNQKTRSSSKEREHDRRLIKCYYITKEIRAKVNVLSVARCLGW